MGAQVEEHLTKQAWDPEFNPQYHQKKIINCIVWEKDNSILKII
jgi:hypothetical protein